MHVHSPPNEMYSSHLNWCTFANYRGGEQVIRLKRAANHTLHALSMYTLQLDVGQTSMTLSPSHATAERSVTYLELLSQRGFTYSISIP